LKSKKQKLQRKRETKVLCKGGGRGDLKKKRVQKPAEGKRLSSRIEKEGEEGKNKRQRPVGGDTRTRRGLV